MERIGEVTAVRGEYLEITFCRPSDCEKCQACQGGQKVTKLHLKGKANRHDSDGWLDFFTHDALYTLLTIQDSLKQEQR